MEMEMGRMMGRMMMGWRMEDMFLCRRLGRLVGLFLVEMEMEMEMEEGGFC